MGIETIRIHPGIGICRLGDSPDDFFVGPELVNDFSAPQGGYRDSKKRIKRQASRFHLYGFDRSGSMVGEITANDAIITWSVRLANGKAAGEKFHGIAESSTGLRNPEVKDRSQLVLDSGIQTISGTNQVVELANKNKFLGFDLPIRLGTLRTDEMGRLMVLGGFGNSGSPSGQPLSEDFANNDGWFDDTSDGSVSAEVRLPDGSRPPVLGAWVVAAPPKYAPGILNVVTLYDVLYQIAVENGWLAVPDPPSFNKHVYPILQRAANMVWVHRLAALSHNFKAEPTADSATILKRLRIPSGSRLQPGTGPGNMPFVWSDLFTLNGPNTPNLNATLTPTQYKVLQSWGTGNFTNDWTGAPPSAESSISPSGLDRAALESCVGAAFYPGIEVSWQVRDVFRFTEPFRLDPTSLAPGDLVKGMALPWQSDFADCADGDHATDNTAYAWWPAQRPLDVIVSPNSSKRSRWARGFDGDPTELGGPGMVKNWSRLGFVLQSGKLFLEIDRLENPSETSGELKDPDN